MTATGTWTGTTVLTTPRLTLRCFREEDLKPYSALNADGEVVEHLGGEPFTPEYTEQIAAWANGLYEREQIGLLAVERTKDRAFLGMCGLHHLDAFPDDIEVAWRLARPHWGHGYATEAASAWLDYGFPVKGLARIISITETVNTRSLAVMKRLGMTCDQEARITEEGMEFDVVVHAITAAGWRDGRRGGRGGCHAGGMDPTETQQEAIIAQCSSEELKLLVLNRTSIDLESDALALLQRIGVTPEDATKLGGTLGVPRWLSMRLERMALEPQFRVMDE